MQVGLNIVSLKAGLLAKGGHLAEEAGFSSVWLGEHLFMPVHFTSEYMAGSGTQPFSQDTPLLDPLLALSHVAAVTSRIRLGVGIYLVALRHPLLTAKLYATLDALSGGRFDFGYAAGWMKEEFDVLGIDFGARGKIVDECLQVMRTLLSEKVPSIDTERFKIPPMGFEPKPTNSRFIGGGYSPVAWRRAVKDGGWYGRLDRLDPETNVTGEWNLEAVAGFVSNMRRKVDEAGGDGKAFHIIGGLSRPATADELDQLAETGLDEVIVNVFPKVDGLHMGVSDSLDSISAYADSVRMKR